MRLLIKLRDELKAGNLSVRYSKRFARLEEFFIDDRRWQGMREDFFRRSGLPSDSKQVPEYLARRLAEAYERFLKTAPSNSYAVVDKDGWRLSAEPTEEHYTDTHGYTKINFAAFAMLGLRFCPRIRGVQHQRIYRIDPNRDYGSLGSLVSRADQTIDTEQIAEHFDNWIRRLPRIPVDAIWIALIDA